MTTESNKQFVNFLFDKLLTTVDTDLIDTLDDDDRRRKPEIS
jgi:hypothetical protein